MREEKDTAHRLAAYSDAVFAVIVTVMVLELRAPDQPAFSALWPLWPTAISYAVSYLFIAIIWINHHYLMRFVGPPTLGLIWINFVHLFMVSLLPFATAWIARTRLASSPWRFTQGCSCTSTLHTTSSSAKYWLARMPRKCPSVHGAWRGADHSLSLRFSRLPC
jgi:TMEM175 potassium channel family protein